MKKKKININGLRELLLVGVVRGCKNSCVYGK